MITFNENPEISKVLVGEEKSPVLIIDNFSNDIPTLLHYLIDSVPLEDEALTIYPGKRGTLPKPYRERMLSSIKALLINAALIEGDEELILTDASLSWVTTPPASLSPMQCFPHFDNKSERSVAFIHYLSPGDFGGTLFFKHSPSGYQRINNDRIQNYLKLAQQHIDECGLPEPGYITQSDEHFELVGSVDYKQNRAVIYPANQLHSGNIRNRDVSESIAKGRVTANFIIEY